VDPSPRPTAGSSYVLAIRVPFSPVDSSSSSFSCLFFRTAFFAAGEVATVASLSFSDGRCGASRTFFPFLSSFPFALLLLLFDGTAPSVPKRSRLFFRVKAG